MTSARPSVTVEIRVKHLTAVQCAVFAVVGTRGAKVGEIWKRCPRFMRGVRCQDVSYGSISATLIRLTALGFIEREKVGPRSWAYRLPQPRKECQ